MPISNAYRAERTWLRIQRDPVSVVFTKPRVVSGDGTVTPAVALAAQTVRVAPDNRATPVEGVAGAAPQRHVLIYGVRGHPDEAIADLDVQEGYTFEDADGTHYRVLKPILVPGGVQAQARATG